MSKLIIPPKKRQITVLEEMAVITRIVGELESLLRQARHLDLHFDSMLQTAQGNIGRDA